MRTTISTIKFVILSNGTVQTQQIRFCERKTKRQDS
jgi:hypothetical protein